LASEQMQNNDWIALFELIPQEQHNMLVLTTQTGVDLNVETILRTEPNFLVFRGRVSGITDEGRVFFLPYNQIDFMQINRQVKEAEIRHMFGDTPDGEGVPGSASGIFASPLEQGVFPLGAGSSHQGLSASPASPSEPAPVLAPTRPSLPAIAARLSHHGTRKSNPPGVLAPAAADADPTPPRNSILERLRAQRNSIPPVKPPR
jgi:hypothetical protein